MITLSQIDALQFSRVFHDIKTLVRKGLVDPELGTISKQAQLLALHCIKLTPPANRKQGKDRTRIDVNKIFHPVDPSKMTSPALAKLVRRSDPVAWAAFSRNVKGPLANTDAIVPTPAIHKANRDRRGRGKKTHFVTLWKQCGELKALRDAAVASVGWAKAGWLKAYAALGGKRIDAWWGRHGQVRGIFEDGRGNATNPYIGTYNNTGWGKAGESKRIVQNAMQSRTKAMQTYFNTAMRLASEGKPTQWQAKMQAAARLTEAQ